MLSKTAMRRIAMPLTVARRVLSTASGPSGTARRSGVTAHRQALNSPAPVWVLAKRYRVRENLTIMKDLLEGYQENDMTPKELEEKEKKQQLEKKRDMNKNKSKGSSKSKGGTGGDDRALDEWKEFLKPNLIIDPRTDEQLAKDKHFMDTYSKLMTKKRYDIRQRNHRKLHQVKTAQAAMAALGCERLTDEALLPHTEHFPLSLPTIPFYYPPDDDYYEEHGVFPRRKVEFGVPFVQNQVKRTTNRVFSKAAPGSKKEKPDKKK